MMQQPRSFRGVKLSEILWRMGCDQAASYEGILLELSGIEGDDMISGTRRGAVSDGAIVGTLDDSS